MNAYTQSSPSSQLTRATPNWYSGNPSSFSGSLCGRGMAIITETSTASGISSGTLGCNGGVTGRETSGGGGGCRNDGSHDVIDGSSGTGGRFGVGASSVVVVVVAESGVDGREDAELDDSVMGVIGRINAADIGWARISTQSG